MNPDMTSYGMLFDISASPKKKQQQAPSSNYIVTKLDHCAIYTCQFVWICRRIFKFIQLPGAVVVLWIYNYLCIQYLSPQTLWVRIIWGVLDTTLCEKVCQWLAAGRWFSPSTPVSSTNKTDRHDMTEILLKVVLSTIALTTIHTNVVFTLNGEKYIFCIY